MSKYQTSLSFLYSLTAMNPRWSTEPARKFLNLLGQPDKGFASIIVSGTVGKGSTCAFLEKVLRQAGYKTGFYISPHLSDFRERIQVNGQMISKTEVINLANIVKQIIKDHRLQLSFHEALLPLACFYFQKKKVDIAILEVGMGWRLDAVNAVESILSIITNIDYDHTQYLGSSLSEIAREKFAISRPGRTLVTAARGEGLKEIKSLAEASKVNLRLVSLIKARDDFSSFVYRGKNRKAGLLGCHQYRNAAVAIEAIEELKQLSFKIGEQALSTGLETAAWPGRFEVLDQVILDCAHNPAGLEAFLKTLRSFRNKFKPNRILCLFGVSYPVGLKEIDVVKVKQMVKLLEAEKFDQIILSQSDYRGIEVKQLCNFFKTKTSIALISNARLAVKKILVNLDKKDLLVITGSIFLVGEVRPALLLLTGPKKSR